MKAVDMLSGIRYDILWGNLECEVTDLTDDSRKSGQGAVFLCRNGLGKAGHSYIEDALSRGAAGIILTESPKTYESCYLYNRNIFVVYIYDFRQSIGMLCNNFWNFPSKKLTVIGITGTKGKTTTSYMIRNMLSLFGKKCGLIGTIEMDDCRRRIPSVNTTPGCVELHRKLADMVENGADYCVMEVSSQGLMKNRVSGVFFDIAVYTNLSYDHVGINEHAAFEEYVRWKSCLFQMSRRAVINNDDVYSHTFIDTAAKAHADITTYGCREGSILCKDIQILKTGSALGTKFHLRGIDGLLHTIKVGLPGIFNVYNALAAVSVGILLGVPVEIMNKSLENVCVPGRLENVKVSGNFTVIIDYAHNAQSLYNVIHTLKQYAPGRIVCVYGCGGNRAFCRRINMGRVSGMLADLSIITTDNPRYEDAISIMRDIESGIKETGGSFIEIENRKEAIRYALTHAAKGDVILLAGKGHETYQEIQGCRIHMDERELIHQIMEEEDGKDICKCNN